MRLTIDTERKVIEIESTLNMGDLIEVMKSLIGKEWKDYSIETKTVCWAYPITYVDPAPPYYVQCDGHLTIN